MSPQLERLKVSELSDAEKDRVLELLLERLGYEIQSFKFDGEPREIDIQRPIK